MLRRDQLGCCALLPPSDPRVAHATDHYFGADQQNAIDDPVDVMMLDYATFDDFEHLNSFVKALRKKTTTVIVISLWALNCNHARLILILLEATFQCVPVEAFREDEDGEVPGFVIIPGQHGAWTAANMTERDSPFTLGVLPAMRTESMTAHEAEFLRDWHLEDIFWLRLPCLSPKGKTRMLDLVWAPGVTICGDPRAAPNFESLKKIISLMVTDPLAASRHSSTYIGGAKSACFVLTLDFMGPLGSGLKALCDNPSNRTIYFLRTWWAAGLGSIRELTFQGHLLPGTWALEHGRWIKVTSPRDKPPGRILKEAFRLENLLTAKTFGAVAPLLKDFAPISLIGQFIPWNYRNSGCETSELLSHTTSWPNKFLANRQENSSGHDRAVFYVTLLAPFALNEPMYRASSGLSIRGADTEIVMPSLDRTGYRQEITRKKKDASRCELAEPEDPTCVNCQEAKAIVVFRCRSGGHVVYYFACLKKWTMHLYPNVRFNAKRRGEFLKAQNCPVCRQHSRPFFQKDFFEKKMGKIFGY